MSDLPRRRWLAGGVAVAAAAAGAGWAWHRQAQDGQDPATALWRSSFTGLSGQPLAMSALRGRPLVLNFWATWCAPCVREMPLFDRFHRSHGARGWQVAGLAVDNQAAVAAFLKRTPVSYPIALASTAGTELMFQLGNRNGGLPFTLVFNSDGRIAHQRLGETHYEELLHWAEDR